MFLNKLVLNFKICRKQTKWILFIILCSNVKCYPTAFRSPSRIVAIVYSCQQAAIVVVLEKWVFSKMSQNLQGSTYARVCSLKLKTLEQVFSCELIAGTPMVIKRGMELNLFLFWMSFGT